MEKIDNVYEIVCRLIGPIEATGDSSMDEERLANLNQVIDVAYKLFWDIVYIARYKENHQSSMQIIGKKADAFLTELKTSLE